MASGAEQRQIGAGPWAILGLLAMGVLISYVDRTSISSVLADKGFVAQFGLDSVERGGINSAFFWSYAAFQVPMGWIVDRYGVKWPYAACFALWCLATTLMGFSSTVAALVLLRLMIGSAEAIVMPASYRWIRNNFEERNNGLAVGLFALGNKLGPAIGAPVAVWFIVNHSWQAMFIATGLVGLAWLGPWLILVRNDLPTRAGMADAWRSAASVPFLNIIRSPVVWGGLITNFCYGYFIFYCMTWMPAYLVEQRGLSLKTSGFYTFVSFSGIAIVAALAGWAADWIIARGHDAVMVRKAFIVAGLVGGSTILLGAYSKNEALAIFWNVASLSLLGLMTANNLALGRLTLIPRQAIGLVTGVQQVATSLAGGVAASLSGWLLEVSGSYDLPMMVIFVFLVIGAVATIALYQPKWAPKVAGSPSD